VVQPPGPLHVTWQSALVPQLVTHLPTSQMTAHVLEVPQFVAQSLEVHWKLQSLLVPQLQLAPVHGVAPGMPDVPEVPELPDVPEVPDVPDELPPSAPLPMVKS